MLIDDLKGFSLLLASRSPRRKQLLEELGLEFRVVIRDWEEAYPSGLEGKEIALYIAEQKPGILPEIKENEIVLMQIQLCSAMVGCLTNCLP